MESRVVLFLVLSLIIIFAYPYILTKFMAPSTPQSTPKSKEIQKGKTDPPAPDGAQQPPPLSAQADRPLSDATLLPERFKIIEGDLYQLMLSSRGGIIKKWELKKYMQKDAPGKRIQLIPQSPTVFPLTLTTPDDALSWDYALDETKVELSPNHPKETVVMTATLPDGRALTKTLTFYNDHYHLDLAVTASGVGEYRLALGSNFGITTWERSMGGGATAISMIDGKLVSEHPKQQTATHDTGVEWFGLHDTYFMSALIPISPQETKDIQNNGAVSVQGKGEQEILASIKVPVRTGGNKFVLYAGPKEYDRLVTYPHFLEEAIDFGWFIHGSWLPVRLVAKPLFYILRFLYGVTQNYGWAIILLTLLIKMIFHPITRKSLVSMKQMAALQPKVVQIREKLADNKEKMNRELMDLYRESGVNPMGGCLPMLLQMPVFIALFNILYMTIDLKNAPFILWISDLSAKDPYYVLPIIMGGTMILQQKMQPSTMDPMQAKIMTFMPVIYTVFFLRFPAGLVLYWLVNNTLSIAQQYWINRT